MFGIVLNKKNGDKVEVGECLAYIHANDEEKVQGAVENLKRAFKVIDKPTSKPKSIIDVIWIE